MLVSMEKPATSISPSPQKTNSNTSLVTLSCQSSGKSIISYLSTETAEVFRVLANFNLLDLFTKTGTITGAVFADDANLLCALRLQALQWDGED